MTHDFKLSSQVLNNGRTAYSAELIGSDEPKFLVGYSTKYFDNFGIYNANLVANLSYKAADFTTKYGFWAQFIAPTAKAESVNSYLCLNTYDRAQFTFGFMQFAAHVPNGDFVQYLKKMLQLPDAQAYFPRLRLKNDRIFYKDTQTGTLSQLESDDSTKGLMEYFNPSLKEVDNQELICAARLIHWTATKADARTAQVAHSIEMFKSNMKQYHKRFGLDGAPAKVCFMVCDILHQGRGTNDRIAYALNTKKDYEKAYKNLCSIGEANYKSRINTVKAEITKLATAFNKKYNAEKNSFI